MKKIYFTIAALILGFTFSFAQTATVYPSDDMTTNSGSSTMFPPTEQLWVANWAGMQNFHQTLIKFDLSSYSGQTITGAKLNLNQFFHAPDGTPTPSKIYAITESWDESTWSISDDVVYGDTEYAAPNFTSVIGWYEIDITALVNKWLSGEITNNGLVIIADSGTKFAEFYSKECEDEANKPNLVIEGLTGVSRIETEVAEVSLFPNPIQQDGTVSFVLNSAQTVNISVVNILGRQVAKICDQDFSSGRHSVQFSCNDLTSGVYFVALQISGDIVTKKVVVQ